MDTKNLLTLRTIVRTGSFQSAAEELGYTPSTITFQIRQLEQELGVPLFERIGRRMVLTRAGETVLPLVESVLQTCDAIGGCGKSLEQMQGTLTVAAPESLLIYGMQEVLRRFRRQAPGVRLFIRAENCYRVREEVLGGSVDLGVRYGVCPENASLHTTPLGAQRACLVAWPELDEADGDFRTPDQIKRVGLINYYVGSVFQERIEDYLRRRRIAIVTTMELWSLEAVKRSVLNHLGVAYLPRSAVEEELAAHTLRQLETEMDDQPISVVCEWHKNKWISPQMELFLSLLRETAPLVQAAAQ